MKKKPQRMCVACRERRDKSDLVRVVYSSDGEVSVDPTGKKAGRGAYVCPNRICLEQAIKANRLEHGLHTKVELNVVDALWEQISAADTAVAEKRDAIKKRVRTMYNDE